ncbi:MFS general substrate transporter [Bimuria novae-zelandiae CBS 107.79]|uniref:MFS general substrate transporter n=1 Tax=Bimuria novae-zelandiae CBS 107.79 TaxID=1447943 RepID=A0A6A5V131_9PLEO|nr:MFS general substrate transporter [Bimuria novae-zelandiae CBS 107.79]
MKAVAPAIDDELDAKEQRHGRHFTQATRSDAQKKIEAKALRKVDWRLIIIFSLLYSVAGLDRVNLSNARAAGMSKDLRFGIGDRYSIALLVFFVTYFLFESPTTLLLRPLRPRYLLNGLAVSWGAVMLGMGFTNDWRYIVVCRILIGAFKAAYLPCCMFLLATWYQRFGVQTRMSWWYLINLFVSAFENILAFAIVKLDGAYGIEGWRWIFIVEGVATIGVAIIGWFLVIDFPDRMLATNNLHGFTQDELQTILDRIDRDRGDSTAVVFLLCAPPYLFSIIWTVGCAWLTDRSRLRMPWMVGNAATTLMGLLITPYSANSGARYFGIFLGKEYPTYRTGVWCAVATQFLLIVLCVVMFMHFRRKNRAAEGGGEVIQEDEDFRYTF